MSLSQPRADEPQVAADQGHHMSQNLDDGDRRSFTAGKDGHAPVEKAPSEDIQDQPVIEEFGAQGMGVAAKE